MGDHRIESFLDMIRNMFPDNIITPTFQMHKTSITYENISLPGKNESIEVEHLQTEKVDAINILGIIIFTVLLFFHCMYCCKFTLGHFFLQDHRYFLS